MLVDCPGFPLPVLFCFQFSQKMIQSLQLTCIERKQPFNVSSPSQFRLFHYMQQSQFYKGWIMLSLSQRFIFYLILLLSNRALLFTPRPFVVLRCFPRCFSNNYVKIKYSLILTTIILNKSYFRELHFHASGDRMHKCCLWHQLIVKLLFKVLHICQARRWNMRCMQFDRRGFHSRDYKHKPCKRKGQCSMLHCLSQNKSVGV